MERIISFSIRHKLIILLATGCIVAFGIFSLLNITIGAVPDITNNQVQVITVARNLATEEVEQFITYPVELEMANLPGVEEIRSISKFGLSVVTIVFDDAMGTYVPRQLIAEKIQSAAEKIPSGFGTPIMGPISTGLGEIYQYVLDVDSAYSDRYSLTDLRTLQDWVVKRQLSGIKGVVEINTWGGYLKQYEVAVNPEKLRAMNLTLHKIYEALQSNNSVSGGGYIEKTNESYFIRGEGLVTSLEDLTNIVVETREGVPVLIRDVATVGYGHAVRFGAITANGTGERVLGQIMMLKDANSGQVINDVKERIGSIQKSLPEGIMINPIVDRSELIGRTTSTVTENLILGCLIVIVVVVLLLGNIRSGLVVASVIPLALLFALSLMYLTGVDANLMSLGAIDFGIIIDGAVIIVEFVAYQISKRHESFGSIPRSERQQIMDTITVSGSTKMMSSALFGQLIIVIVFIPILSLSGVEGKMFKPMALTFSFALVGAIFLCFTYVPVICSLVLRPDAESKRNIARRILAFIERMHKPTMEWALEKRKFVLIVSVALLVGAGFLFKNMGGEFVPTLDEGDFVIQPVLKTGTTLTNTINTVTQIENILLQFPEVDRVVTRIGAAEIPTDPMSMEETDVIIKLKPKREWVTTSDKDELADTLKKALTVLPGIEYEFTQPIEMRFNELITGVRADVAVKIFGDDLNVLSNLALNVEENIQNVEGASDIMVEKITGLPQMTVRYNRAKIARYGLNIADLNMLVSAGFAGLTAGSIFEKEKRFDLVIRFEKEARSDIENLRNLYVPLPNGGQIPLRELAEIEYSRGPAKISRDDTKRRIVIGINVRNRDLESVVKEIQSIIDQKVKLPVGYSITYGGQFENLRNAKERLAIAVPVALVLIFFMLYFAFHSVKDALMIYSAIPLSAVGGVTLLWLRDMPFSISAGVGFIALFGIAVLNGIVLIEHFKELKEKGIVDIRERVIRGTQERLRPVLLTATAAAMGFLPMALSTNAGAEVQRPLATVVIGGLVSATLLTLVVLPVLYSMVDSNELKIRRVKPMLLLVCFLVAIPFSGSSQQQCSLSLQDAIATATTNNAGLQSSALSVDQSKALVNAAITIDRTSLYFMRDANNLPPVGDPLSIWGISQTLNFPTVYGRKKQVAEGMFLMEEQQHELNGRKLAMEVSKSYYKIVYLQNLMSYYTTIDSMLEQFAHTEAKRYALGETNYLEKLTVDTKRQESALRLKQTQNNIESAYSELNRWLQSDSPCRVNEDNLQKVELDKQELVNHPGVLYYQQWLEKEKLNNQLEKSKLLPDINVSYFQGRNSAENNKLYPGFQIGLGVPLWYGSQKATIHASRVQVERIEKQAADYSVSLNARYDQLQLQLNKHQEALDFYNTSGGRLSAELMTTARKSYSGGEIPFLQYVLVMEQALNIQVNHLMNVYQYNVTAIEMNYLVD